jgi:HSP20 family protein
MGVSPADVQQMMQDFEKWTGSPSGGSWSADAPERPLRFPVDIQEDAETYTFLADLPGVSRADTKVQANKEERKLTISGSRAAPQQDEGQQRRRRGERRFGNFTRSFTLPDDADLSGITAGFKDGVLSVTVKRVKPVEPEVEDVPIDDWIDIPTAAEDDEPSFE